VGEDSTRYITAWAVEKIQQVAEAKAPWQLKNSFHGYKLEKQHLDQPDHEIDLLIGQDNHAIFPTYIAKSTVEGGGLSLMRTIFGYPFLLWGQCARGEGAEQVDEVCEHFELMRASKASPGARRRSVTADVTASVRHQAPKKGEPEKYPSTGTRSQEADAEEFTPSQACGADHKQFPALA